MPRVPGQAQNGQMALQIKALEQTVERLQQGDEQLLKMREMVDAQNELLEQNLMPVVEKILAEKNAAKKIQRRKSFAPSPAPLAQASPVPPSRPALAPTTRRLP